MEVSSCLAHVVILLGMEDQISLCYVTVRAGPKLQLLIKGSVFTSDFPDDFKVQDAATLSRSTLLILSKSSTFRFISAIDFASKTGSPKELKV